MRNVNSRRSVRIVLAVAAGLAFSVGGASAASASATTHDATKADAAGPDTAGADTAGADSILTGIGTSLHQALLSASQPWT